MAYTSGMATGTNYLTGPNIFSTINEPVTLGGHFRWPSVTSGLRRVFMSLNQGGSNLQSFGLGARAGGIGFREVRMIVYDGGSIDDSDDGTQYVENEWWFIALVCTNDTTRTLYWQAPGDSVIQSVAGDGSELTIVNVDSVSFGSRTSDTADSFATDIDIFQCGVAFSALGTTELQSWADGTAVEDITGMNHAWPLVSDFNDAIGSANLTETGTVTNVTDPFTPTPGGGGGSTPKGALGGLALGGPFGGVTG